MPRFYPDNVCDFYAERLVDNYHNPRLHVLRENPFKNTVRWFRDQDHSDSDRSFICSWGGTAVGEKFQENTGLKCNKYIRSRLRKHGKFPVGGQPGLWKISRVEPCGFGRLQPHTWNLEEWIQQSSFRQRMEDKSKSSSRRSSANKMS